jgi:hypothetical protein
MISINCDICRLFNKYDWDISQIDKFNSFIQNEYKLGFNDYQKEQLKFEFSILIEDISLLSHYHILRHKRECIVDESVALTVGEQEPEDFITRKEARELISNFRKLDYKDKKSVAAQNWLEVVVLLIASTKKNIERNIKNNSEHVLTGRDIRISKIITDTFKIPSFETELELKSVNDNRLNNVDKFKGKLKDIKELLIKD